MPQCPRCGARAETPTKVYSVLGEPDRSGTMLKQRVGIFHCPKCSIKWPHSLTSQRLAIVKAESLQKLNSEVINSRDTISKLQERIREVEEEKAELQAKVRFLEEMAIIKELQARADALEKEVLLLRESKRGLEDEVAKYEALMVHREGASG